MQILKDQTGGMKKTWDSMHDILWKCGFNFFRRRRCHIFETNNGIAKSTDEIGT